MYRMGVIGLLLLSLLVAVGFAASNDVAERSHVLRADEVTKRADGMRLNLSIAEPQIAPVPVNDGWASVLEIPGADMLHEEGMAPVPMASKLFRLPPTGGAEAVILDATYETMTGFEYAAWMGMEGDEPVFGDLDDTVDEWYPANIAEVGTPSIVRKFRVANLVTYPVQVNAYRNEVRVYSNVEVDIQYTPTGENELDSYPTALSKAYLPFYQSFLDWELDEIDDFELYRGAVQVVVRNSALPSIQQWLNWKRQRGYVVEILTDNDVSWNSSSIYNALEDRWTSSDRPFDWLVIIGDDTGPYSVPPRQGYGDDGYVLFEGNDHYPEAGVGRISVESQTELLGYMNKVLFYETQPYLVDNGWHIRGCVGAGSSSSGISTIYLGRYARHAMLDLGYTEVDTAWYNQGVNVNNENEQSIEQGVSFFSYRGYINSGLSQNEITALDNQFMLPMVLHVTCGTGNWTNGFLGKNEAWMRAGSLNEPAGGIGAISVATSSTHTRYNNALCGGAIYSALVLRNPEMGGTIFHSKVSLSQAFDPWASGSVDDFSEWTNLMGDPSVWLWTALPEVLTVDHPAEIEYGRNGFEVFVYDEDDNPVKNAWVTLYQESDEIQVTGETDAQGRIVLDTPFTDIGSNVKLTVSGQNLEPYQVDVPVVQNTLMAVIDYRIIDNGQGGTNGNGNGLAEPGERVGLWVKLHNLFNVTAPNVGTIFTVDDPAVTQNGGVARFYNIAPDQEKWATSLMLMDIAPTAQSGWFVDGEIGIGIVQGNGQPNVLQTDIASFKIHAPEYAMVNQTISGNIVPGGNAQIHFDLANIGTTDGRPGQIRLISDDPYLTVNTGFIPFGGLDMGETGSTGQFTITAHPSSFKGYPAKAMLQVVSQNPLHADTVYTRIQLGTPSDTDPVGPDGYGYIAFDDRDTDYDLAPEFDWIEINPDAPNSDYNGTQLAIYDSGEEDDDAAVIDLPFPITFYGEEFDEMTVTCNGFVSMGHQTDMRTPRNWPIPSPLGPNYMIAPYWDDRELDGDGGVYYYYDEPNGRMIIEWWDVSEVRVWQNPSAWCTFQLIIYDQIGEHITVTGDNNIKFQYLDVTHTPSESFDNDYMTVGIENGNQTDGLELAYWHGPSEDDIVDGRAILITTQAELITGTIAGTVTYQTGGDPVVGATVRDSNGAFVTTTNGNGQYALEEIVIGDHDIVVEMLGINTAVIEDVHVEEDEVTLLPVQVTAPGFVVDPEEIEETLPPSSDTAVNVTVNNPGDGELTFDVGIDFEGPGGNQIDEEWDLLADFTLDQTPDNRQRGMAWHQGYLWVAGSNNFQNPNKLYRYSPGGVLQQTYDQPVPNPSNPGFYCMTSDGEYLYGVDGNDFYQIEFNEDTGAISVANSVELPTELTMTRYLAWDSTNDIFWIGERYTPIYAINRQGNIITSIDPEMEVLALADYPEDPDGYTLYMYLQETPYVDITVMKMDVTSGTTQFVVNLPANVFQIKDAVITYLWDPFVWAMFVLKDGSAMDDVIEIYEVAINSAWMNLSTESETVPAGGNVNFTVNLASLDLPEGSYSNWLRFDTNTYDEHIYVPVTLNVSANGVITAVGENVNQPLEWAFKGVYPNPFNPTTTVSFSMKEAANARVALFNVLGQEVTTLVNREMEAGHHMLTVDGENLASGVYFLRFQAGPLNETRKVVLMR